jgi:ribose transport system substrate-binding protein
MGNWMSARNRNVRFSLALRGNCILLLALALLTPTARAEQVGPAGITQPTKFPIFNPDAPPCSPPPDLTKSLTYIQENEREFLQGVNSGLSMAAKDRHLDYRRVVVENDVANTIKELETFRSDKGGALVATSSDPRAVSSSVQKIIWSGAYVGTVVPPPATLLLNAPQYATGKALTDAAVSYIKSKLGGKATVVLLTQDSMQYLSPRFDAMRHGLDELPGVTIVADIAPNPVTKEGGYATMNAVLLANPDVDVVLGGDAVVLGALQALRDAKKDRPDQFLGGIDGEPEAVAEIKKGDSPYKVSIALSSPVFGYAMGQYGADWLEGKSTPQAMDILPTALSKENIQQYEADLANPGAVFADSVRRGDI